MIAATILMGPAAIAGCVVFFLVIPVQARDALGVNYVQPQRVVVFVC